MRHLIQICNLATGSKVVSWTGALNSQVSGSDRPANYRLRNHCVVRIYPQVASLIGASLSEPHIDELHVRNLYIYYYGIWYVRHPRAAIYNVQQLAIYSGGRMKKLLRSPPTPVPRA